MLDQPEGVDGSNAISMAGGRPSLSADVDIVAAEVPFYVDLDGSTDQERASVASAKRLVAAAMATSAVGRKGKFAAFG